MAIVRKKKRAGDLKEFIYDTCCRCLLFDMFDVIVCYFKKNQIISLSFIILRKKNEGGHKSNSEVRGIRN